VAEAGIDDVAEAGAEDVAEAGTDDVADAGTDDVAEAGIEEVAQAGIEDVAQAGTGLELLLLPPVDLLDYTGISDGAVTSDLTDFALPTAHGANVRDYRSSSLVLSLGEESM
jgi:hypothetical protein